MGIFNPVGSMFGIDVDSSSFMGQAMGSDPQFAGAYEDDLQDKLDDLTWKMDPREEALALRMLTYLDTKEAEYDKFAPLLQKIMGYTTDANGDWVPMTDEQYKGSLGEVESKDYELYRLMQGRQQLALEGQAPISVGTQQRKEQDFRTFQKEMRRRGSNNTGDSFENATATDTAGIQSLEAKRKEWAYTEDNERQMQLQTGAGNLMGFGQYQQGLKSAKISEIDNYLNRNMAVFDLMNINRQIWQDKGLTEFENEMWKFTFKYNDARERFQFAVNTGLSVGGMMMGMGGGPVEPSQPAQPQQTNRGGYQGSASNYGNAGYTGRTFQPNYSVAPNQGGIRDMAAQVTQLSKDFYSLLKRTKLNDRQDFYSKG